LEVPAFHVFGPEQKANKCHSNSIASGISRARRKRQRLPSSLLIENASDRDSALPNTVPETFPIGKSPHVGLQA